MDWVILEGTFSFIEMCISCFFASGIFRKNIKGSETIFALILFSFLGAALLILRQYAFTWIPDFLPAVLIFTLYAIVACQTKWWAAVSWALVNYLFIGILSVTTDYVLSIYLNSPVEIEMAVGSVWFYSCVITRIGQFLLSETILCVWKRFPVSKEVYHGSWKIIIVSSISIIMVWILWGKGSDFNDEVLYSNGLVCLLVLAINLLFLLFDEVLAREKNVEEELKTQNQLIALQMRNQDEVNNMYRNVLALKHDMNNHLHTISGYMQVGEYVKAQEYVGKIAREVSSIKSFHSGNTVIDALVGSKTALAEMNDILVEVDMAVPSELVITDEDLTVMIGNLYDNAIDASMRLADVHKRFIQIKIFFDCGNLLILFENATMEQKRISNKGIWVTTKEDSAVHGFGIKNIDRIIKKYGGYCERELRDHVFRCRIRIPGK